VYNHIVLVGRLTRDPVQSYANDIPVSRFTLAVDRPAPRGPDGQKQTDFIDVAAWRQLSDQVQRYLTKGRLVLVSGRLQIRAFQGRDGVWRRIPEIVATQVRFLDRAPAEQATEPAPVEAAAPAAPTRSPRSRAASPLQPAPEPTPDMAPVDQPVPEDLPPEDEEPFDDSHVMF
jgi:single-strand DNA-binding protein